MSDIKIIELSGSLQVEFLNDGRSARLLKDYHVLLIVDGKVFDVVCPAGEITDFASSPPRLWGLFPPIGKGITEGAVVHDHMYKHPGEFTRKQIDEIFREIMLAKGTSNRKARLGYYGVRLGGWVAWKKYRKAEE